MRRTMTWGLAALCIAGCGVNNQKVGSKYVKSQLVTAAQGGTVTVTQKDDQALAGTAIAIPPGALAKDTTITITASTAPVAPADAQASGPVVDFGPDGTKFSTPATITLPYQLPSGMTTADLFVAGQESNGTALTFDHAALTIDESAKTMAFKVNGFTRYGGAARHHGNPDAGETDAGPSCLDNCRSMGVACVNPASVCWSDGQQYCNTCYAQCAGATQVTCNTNPCRTDADCPSGEVCSNGVCRPQAQDGGPSSCSSDAQCGCNCGCVSGRCECTGAIPPSCTIDADCGPVCSGLICSNGQCVQAPSSDGGSNTTCRTDADCASGYVCMSGYCSSGNSCLAVCQAQGIACVNPASVCWSDGQQYCNTCYAQCYGATQVACSDGGAADAGTACPPGTTCSGAADAGAASTCALSADCAAGSNCCGGTCVNVASDPSNCGICGGVCATGQVCSSGRCVPACASSADCAVGSYCCSGICVDVASDPSHCGACGTACAAGQSCVSGRCM